VKLVVRLLVPALALLTFPAEAADVTGDWTATIVTATGQQSYTYAFRQNGATLIGTVRSQDRVAAISNGFINNTMITFDENVTTEGRRTVLEYTGELVSDTEIEFKRQVKGEPYSAIQFVARRIGKL
jgi:hypothetical protein